MQKSVHIIYDEERSSGQKSGLFPKALFFQKEIGPDARDLRICQFMLSHEYQQLSTKDPVNVTMGSASRVAASPKRVCSFASH